MVRLTPELIEDSFQYVNPVREYELNLRGHKIGLIENLGATLNQFDTIDLTDNDIRRLDGFPFLSKLKSLMISNNKIQHIGNNLELNLTSLETLILINNNIEELIEIDQLSTIKTLKNLSLIRNPIASLKHYRLYAIYKIPSLRILDFKKIKDKERDQAQKMFKGKKLKQANKKAKTFVPGEQLDKLTLAQNINNTGFNQDHKQKVERLQPSKEDIDAIRIAISQAKSIEEIEQLNAMLRSGIIPVHLKQHQQLSNQAKNQKNNMVEEEEDDNQQSNYQNRMDTH